jgi:hypothetical protein
MPKSGAEYITTRQYNIDGKWVIRGFLDWQGRYYHSEVKIDMNDPGEADLEAMRQIEDQLVYKHILYISHLMVYGNVLQFYNQKENKRWHRIKIERGNESSIILSSRDELTKEMQKEILSIPGVERGEFNK